MTDYRKSKCKSRKNLLSFEEFLKSDFGKEFISYARISTYCKGWRELLEQQHDYTKSIVSSYELATYKEYSDVIHGYEIGRKGLDKAAKIARKRNIPIFVQDIDRLIRHFKFHPVRNNKVKPTEEQIDEFLEYYHGITFVIIDSDEKIKRNKTLRGQIYKENKGGGDRMPGYLKRRKIKIEKYVKNLKAFGCSYRKIEKLTGISKQTIWRCVIMFEPITLKNDMTYWNLVIKQLKEKKSAQAAITHNKQIEKEKRRKEWVEAKITKTRQEERARKRDKFNNLVKLARKNKLKSNKLSNRNSIEYRAWKQAVHERDNFQCVKCGSTKDLVAHHIKEWAYYPYLRFKLNNGVSLCVDCHGYVHDWLYESPEMSHVRSIKNEGLSI